MAKIRLTGKHSCVSSDNTKLLAAGSVLEVVNADLTLNPSQVTKATAEEWIKMEAAEYIDSASEPTKLNPIVDVAKKAAASRWAMDPSTLKDKTLSVLNNLVMERLGPTEKAEFATAPFTDTRLAIAKLSADFVAPTK